MPERSYDSIRAVEWHEGALRLLDQRNLPQQLEFIRCNSSEEVAQAIRSMVVRGAPAIGIAAAYGVVLAARRRYARSPASWKRDIEEDLEGLATARPTAVNLAWSMKRMKRFMDTISGDPEHPLLGLARHIHAEDIAANKAMGALGASLIKQHCAVLTHCNTGSLATGGYGTALGVIRAAHGSGRISQVFVDETRPWLQGARLTAWELVQDSIPVTLVAEGAAAHLMKQGEVKWVIVGADRIAGNGDVANKIGTYNAAVVARYHGVKLMVVAPTSTIDLDVSSGREIPIEIRPEQELLTFSGRCVAPLDARAWNPVFDVTPAGLVDAIVTEKGVVRGPTAGKMERLMENDGK